METGNKGKAIEIRNVVKEYAGHRVLKGVSLEVGEGNVFGLLGPNGAGKTTLIRMLTGITAPDSGEIRFFGEPWSRQHIRSVGYLPEERGLYKSMRVGEQALYLARLRGLSRDEAQRRLRAWFERLEVDGWWNREVADLSKGMAQKIQFIASVVHEPRLLILDEPLSGFDPINAQRIREAVLDIRKEWGTTVLLSTHDMGSVEELCDEVALLNHGEVVLAGPVAQLREEARGGKIELRYRGNAIGCADALGASAQLISSRASEDPSFQIAVVELAPGVSLPEWIHRISGGVEIYSVAPHATAMRDIFIRAVQSPQP